MRKCMNCFRERIQSAFSAKLMAKVLSLGTLAIVSITNYVMLLNIDHMCAVHFLLEGKLEGCVRDLRAQNVQYSKRVFENPQIANLCQKKKNMLLASYRLHNFEGGCQQVPI